MAIGDKKPVVMVSDLDDAPVAESHNPVKSGGVYDALRRKPNRNLLDNGYFVGGGSQQGGGQFPINQRGETEYTQNGYCIDRWAIAATPNGTVSLDKNGLRLETKGNYGYLIQKIEPYRTQVGKILTFSVLLTNGKLLSTSGIFPAVKDTDDVFASTGDGDMAIMIVRLGTSLDGYLHPQIRFINNGATVVAAKLEESPVQTLAHKEGDMWVLNDPPPDKTLEEMKCKARYIGGKLYGYVAAMYADAIAFSVPMGVTMNANPTLIGSDFGVYKQPGDIKEEGFSFMQAEARNGALLCMMSKPQHGFSASDTLVLYVGTGSGFSAEP